MNEQLTKKNFNQTDHTWKIGRFEKNQFNFLLHTTEKQELEHTKADEDKIIIVLLAPSLRRCIMILSVNQRFSSTNSTCS